MEKLRLSKANVFFQCAAGVVENEDRRFVTAGFPNTRQGMEEANALARRLVAAYNACKDIEIQSLENGTVKELMGEIMAQNSRLLAKNAQLSELKEAIYNALAEWNLTSNSNEFVSDVRSALAKEHTAAETATEKTKTP
jgi:hypothetical protein